MKYLQKLPLILILIGFLTFSCEQQNNLKETIPAQNAFTVKNGTLKFENNEDLKFLIEEIKKTGAENFYKKQIKKLTKEGYEPLRPYFSEEEIEEHEAFIEKKGKRLQKTREAEGIFDEEIEFDIEDELIVDSNFEVLLNFNREIIVEHKLYRYTRDGIYSVEEDKIIEFRNIVKSQTTQNKRTSGKTSLPSGITFIKMNLRSEMIDNENQTTKKSNTQLKSRVRYSDLAEAKLNFGVEVFKKNPSVWGKIFGYSRYAYDWAPNKRRVKIKFWNRNWLLFSSMGIEVRFQKKKKFWKWSYYVKSYPDKIALGVNSLQYNYKQVLEPYISPTVFDNIYYTYKGINYHSNGKISLEKPPKLQFPIDKLLSPDDLYVTIVNPLNNRVSTVGQSSEQIVKTINDAASDLLKEAIKSIPSSFEKPNENTTVSILNILKDGTELTIFNQNWIREKDNNITKRLVLDVPLIGIKSTLDGDGGFTKNTKVPFPELSLSNYETGSIDIYGGAFYKGKWYGKRLISSDFNRK